VGLTLEQTARIIIGMRDVYAAGGNAMEWCREELSSSHGYGRGNDLLATLVAYDLQAGCYVAGARRNSVNNQRWCRQVADLLEGILSEGDSVLEVGVGEATTLSGVLKEIRAKPSTAFGFDVSWSRISVGRSWLAEEGQDAFLFVGDLLNIPLADSSIDVVYSSYSLEPNLGNEERALNECLRVARKAVVLVEPLYELAPPDAQARMRHHGYVQGLRETAEHLGAKVLDYRLLEYSSNPLNPSGVLCLGKEQANAVRRSDRTNDSFWRCPTTGLHLEPGSDLFYAPTVGIAYPVLRAVPMLRAEHRIVASKLKPTL